MAPSCHSHFDLAEPPFVLRKALEGIYENAGRPAQEDPLARDGIAELSASDSSRPDGATLEPLGKLAVQSSGAVGPEEIIGNAKDGLVGWTLEDLFPHDIAKSNGHHGATSELVGRMGEMRGVAAVQSGGPPDSDVTEETRCNDCAPIANENVSAAES
jgi:hypothetical protein